LELSFPDFELSFDFVFLWLIGGDFVGRGGGGAVVEVDAREEGLVGSFSGVGGRTG
jgi:hypothetical protein